MTKLNRARILLGVFTIIGLGIFVFETFGNSAADDMDDKLKLLAIPQGTTTTSTTVANSVQAATKVVKDTDGMEFKIAPEYNDFFAASQLIANSINPTLEQEWIKHRLGTRVARENAAREKAELEEQQYQFEKLQVAAQIDAMEKGKGSFDLNALGQAFNVGGNSVGPNGKTNQTHSTRQMAVKRIKLTSMQEDEENTVTLRIGDNSYRNLTVGATAGGYTVTNINISSMCVSLEDRFGNPKNVCMG